MNQQDEEIQENTLPPAQSQDETASTDLIHQPASGSPERASGPFTAIQPQPQAPTGPFTTLAHEVNGSPNPYSEQQTLTTAALATAAQNRLGMSGDDQIAANSEANFDLNSKLNADKIAKGQEINMRAQIAEKARTQEMNGLQQLQTSVLSGDNMDVTAGQTLKAMVQTLTKPADPNALEKQGLAHLQELGATDPAQAAGIQFLLKGDILGKAHDDVLKAQLYNREMDRLQQEAGKESAFGKFLDFATDLIPFKGYITGVGNVPGVKMDFWSTPGGEEEKEVRSLWDMPVDQFEQTLPKLFDNFRNSALDLGHGNLGRAVELATKYRASALSQTTALQFDAATGLDFAAMLPLGKIVSVPSKAVRMLGNRVLSTDIVSNSILRQTSHATLALDGIQLPVHSIEESLPSSVIPDLGSPRADIGVPGDVARRLRSIREATQASLTALQRVSRLEPQQAQEAVQQEWERIKAAHSDTQPVVDYKRQVLPISKAQAFEIDPEADLDSLSYFNARGELVSSEDKAAVDELVKEAQEAFARGREKLRGEIGGLRSLYPQTTIVPEIMQGNESGIYSLKFWLGKNGGEGGFITREGAEAAAQRKGFSLDDVDIHQNDDAQWYVGVTHPVTETGIATPAITRADLKGAGRVRQYLSSLDNLQPELFNQSRLTQTIGRSKFVAGVVKPWVSNIKQLGGSDIKRLGKVMASGEQQQKWFTPDELTYEWARAAGRDPEHFVLSEKQMMSYYSAKELSDINYQIFNRNVFIENSRRGWGTVSVDGGTLKIPRQNGRVLENPSVGNLRISDADTGAVYKGSATAEAKEKLDSGTHRLIELQEPHVHGGEPHKYILAPTGDSTLGPLDHFQLEYVEGGSRENAFKWYVKQANGGTFKDGSRYWGRPITHIASRTSIQARQWADAMEAARQAYIHPTMDDAMKHAIIERSPAESYESFHQLVKSGAINLDHPFEVLYDKASPAAMTGLGETDTRWYDPTEDANTAYYMSKGRMYYSDKGERLKDPVDNYAEILDPLTTLHNATMNAAKTLAFSDYHRKVVDEWARMAAPYIDRKSVGNNLDNGNLFWHGEISRELRIADPQLANQLDVVRNTHKRFMNMDVSPENTWRYGASRKLAAWLETGDGGVRDRLANSILDRGANNPINAVRGWVFDAHLGFFDPSRLWVHTQTAFNAMAANPIYGARAATMAPILTHVLLNRSENLLDFYAKNLVGLHGLEASDWKNMVRSLRSSGWLNVGGEQIQLDQYLNKVGGSMIARNINDVRDAGRVMFNLAEKYNRVVAYQMAWHAIRDKLPDALAEEPEFLQMVNKKADDYSMNMTASSGAFWQKGVLSVPTQFLAYQTRLLENILPAWAGGSTRFTAAQKLRMAIGQFVMYGTGGIPLAGYVASQYQKATGNALDPQTWRTLTKGFWDTLLFDVSGGKLDTDVAYRAGTGEGWGDVVGRFFDPNNKTFLGPIGDIALGPTSGLIDAGAQAIDRISRLARSEQTVMLRPEEWKLISMDLARNVSTMKYGMKAYFIWKTGMLKNLQTGENIVPEDDLAGFAAAVGIPFRQEIEVHDLYSAEQQKIDDASQVAKLLTEFRKNAVQAMWDNDTVKEREYNNMAAALMMPYRSDPIMQDQIIRQTNTQYKKVGPTWQATVDRLKNNWGIHPEGGK